MFYPKGTIIKIKKKNTADAPVKAKVVSTESENFDNENSTGILIATTSGSEPLRVTTTDYFISLETFPSSHLRATQEWHFVVDRLTGEHHFFTDNTIKENEWMEKRMLTIKKVPAGYSFEEVEKMNDELIKMNKQNNWKC